MRGDAATARESNSGMRIRTSTEVSNANGLTSTSKSSRAIRGVRPRAKTYRRAVEATDSFTSPRSMAVKGTIEMAGGTAAMRTQPSHKDLGVRIPARIRRAGWSRKLMPRAIGTYLITLRKPPSSTSTREKVIRLARAAIAANSMPSKVMPRRRPRPRPRIRSRDGMWRTLLIADPAVMPPVSDRGPTRWWSIYRDIPSFET